MKKFIYIILFVLVSAATFSACTEDEVAPSHELQNGGGNGSGDKGGNS